MPKVRPTGLRHEVGLGELFFSTTDKRGVIDLVNPVFVRLSHYSADQLIGAPHNIIRHPAMPGAVFKLMWDTLTQNKPFCGYVHNLAADGSTYSMFATITPISGGYLSVRMRPMYKPFRDLADELYKQVRPKEIALLEQSFGSHRAASRGLEVLAGLIEEAGFSSYEDVTLATLPKEVELLSQIPLRGDPDTVVGVLREELNVSNALATEFGLWTARMEQLANFADRLDASTAAIERSVENSSDTSEQIRRRLKEDSSFASSSVYLRVWADISVLFTPMLNSLSTQLEMLKRSCARTRFDIALAVLHNRVVNQFIYEGAGPAGQSAADKRALASLSAVLIDDTARTSELSSENSRLADATGSYTSELVGLLNMPQMMIRY